MVEVDGQQWLSLAMSLLDPSAAPAQSDLARSTDVGRHLLHRRVHQPHLADRRLRLILEARDNPTRTDPKTVIINFTEDASTNDDSGTPDDYVFPNLRSGPGRTDVTVIDDETAGVVSIISGTDTVVQLCGDAACTIPGTTDDYTLRLTKQPKTTTGGAADVRIAVVTDGLVDVTSIGGVAVAPAAYQRIGGYLPSRVFFGNLTFSGTHDHPGQRQRPRQLHRRGLQAGSVHPHRGRRVHPGHLRGCGRGLGHRPHAHPRSPVTAAPGRSWMSPSAG